MNSFKAYDNPNLTCIKIDNGFTPPSNWVKDNTASYNTNCALSTNDFENFKQVTIYPNPVKNILNIQLEENQEVKNIEILTIEGRSVQSIQKASTIDIENLDKGIYLIKVKTLDDKVSVKKIIKE